MLIRAMTADRHARRSTPGRYFTDPDRVLYQRPYVEEDLHVSEHVEAFASDALDADLAQREHLAIGQVRDAYEASLTRDEALWLAQREGMRVTVTHAVIEDLEAKVSRSGVRRCRGSYCHWCERYHD